LAYKSGWSVHSNSQGQDADPQCSHTKMLQLNSVGCFKINQYSSTVCSKPKRLIFKAGGQCSPLPSQLLIDDVRSVHSSYLSWLGSQMEPKSQHKLVQWHGIETTTSQLTFPSANHYHYQALLHMLNNIKQ